MGHVFTYPGTGKHLASDFLIVEKGYEEMLSEDVEAGRAERPLRCFAVSGDNISRHGYTLAKYLSYESGRTVTPNFQEKQGEQILFFKQWECFVAAFNARTLGNYINAIGDAYEPQNHFFPSYDALTSFLESFSTTVVVPLLELTPFIGRECFDKPYL